MSWAKYMPLTNISTQTIRPCNNTTQPYISTQTSNPSITKKKKAKCFTRDNDLRKVILIINGGNGGKL
jgi:hypothetical protein